MGIVIPTAFPLTETEDKKKRYCMNPAPISIFPVHLPRKQRIDAGARRARGFTLIELLTVIAIIGILAAILIPVTGAVRESAKRANCLSNQRQILGALHLHANDNKGYLPIAARATNPDGSSSSMRWVREPAFIVYLPMMQRSGSGSGKWENNIFICPSAMNPSGLSGDDLRVTYAASAALYGPDTDGSLGKGVGKNRPRLLSSINSPGRTIMIFDGKLILAGTHTNYSYFWHEVSPDATLPLDQTVRLNFLHKSSMNVGMVDGSVRGMTQAEFATFTEGRWRGIE